MKNTSSEVKELLAQKFDARHITAALNHFSATIEKYAAGDWEGVAVKAGKFVEAITKSLIIHCGKTVSGRQRDFKAGVELRQLEQTPTTYSDVVRVVIPKACIFVYETVNNRGGRHDAHDIDANAMDAKAIVPITSWVLADLVRFCSINGDTAAAAALMDELTTKTYPFSEVIDGRRYIEVKGLKPGEIALLLLDSAYPKRINRQELVDQVVRHGVTRSAANTAVHRLKSLVDDNGGEWKIRGLGRQEADKLRARLASKMK